MSKPTLLLLPGMLCDGISWDRVPSRLQDVAEPVVVDYGTADTVDRMAELVLSRAPERFAVAGHSMGGRVALAVQHRAPDRVIALGLFGTSCEGHADAAAEQRERTSRAEQIETARRQGMRAFAEDWLPRMMLPAHCADPALRGRFLDMVERLGLAIMQSHINAGLTRRDMTWWLPSIRCPTLVLAGAEDVGRPPPVHRAMAERIPGATLAIIGDAGHMVMMERPEPVAVAIRGWLVRAIA